MNLIPVHESDMQCVRSIFPTSRLQADCTLDRWPEWAQTVAIRVAEHAAQKLAAGPDKVLRCAFCAQPYPDGTPEAKSQILADHIRVCEAHPVGRENRELRERLRQVEACQDGFTKWANEVIGTCEAPYNPGMELGDSQFHELINLKAASVLQQGMRKS